MRWELCSNRAGVKSASILHLPSYISSRLSHSLNERLHFLTGEREMIFFASEDFRDRVEHSLCSLVHTYRVLRLNVQNIFRPSGDVDPWSDGDYL